MKAIKEFQDESIDCIITSPPYWQLRDYGYPKQWGLEPTYQEYLEHLWQFMDECKRVLKKTGTCWINLGDTYGTTSGGSNQLAKGDKTKYGQINHDNRFAEQNKDKMLHKCLLLIPHRFAIGCIDRGWIMRNDIVWAKRNGMPESVTDRFSKKHEYIFFMAKNQNYYFDLDGIRDKHNVESLKRELRGNREGNKYSSGIEKPEGVHANTTSKERKFRGYDDLDKYISEKTGKNPGSVSDFWDIPTKGSSEKHYASFNYKLIEKPIMAGCPKGGIILDPFCGTGTTLVRALQLGRKVIGIDGNKEYCEIAEKRINEEKQILRMFK